MFPSQTTEIRRTYQQRYNDKRVADGRDPLWKEDYYKNHDKRKGQQREWRKRTGAHRKQKLARYGLTLELFHELLAKQEGKCAVCQGVFEETWTGFVNLYPRVDHCHTTQKVRGLLCHDCNVALGHVKDSVERLKAMICYLEANNEGRAI